MLIKMVILLYCHLRNQNHNTLFDPKKFSTHYSSFKIESNTATGGRASGFYCKTKSSSNKGLFATEISNAETKEGEVFNWWNLNKKKYPHHASFARK